MNKIIAIKDGWVCKNFDCRNFEVWVSKDVNPDRWCNRCSKELKSAQAEFKSYKLIDVLDTYKFWINVILASILSAIYVARINPNFIYSVWLDFLLFLGIFTLVGYLGYGTTRRGAFQNLFINHYPTLSQTNLEKLFRLVEPSIPMVGVLVYIVWFW